MIKQLTLVLTLLLMLFCFCCCGDTAPAAPDTPDTAASDTPYENTEPSSEYPAPTEADIPATESNDTPAVDPIVTDAPEENAAPSSEPPATAAPDTEINNTPDVAPSSTDEPFSLSAGEASYPLGVNEIIVTLCNTSGETLYFGDEYTIEQLSGSEWIEVPLDYVFNSVENILDDGNIYDCSVWLCPEMYNYTAGTYRVKKMCGDRCVYAQFELV